MKRFISGISFLVLLASCNPAAIILEGNKVQETHHFNVPLFAFDYDDHAVIIKSFEEAQEIRFDYVNHEIYSPEWDSQFVDFIDRYTERYFLENDLVLAGHWEGSGSNQVTFLGLRSVKDTLVVHIKREFPSMGTCDMKYWSFGFDINKSYGLAAAQFEFHDIYLQDY